MARNEIEQYPNASFIGFGDKALQIRLGAVARRYAAVSCILERGFEDRVDPNRIYAKRGDVIKTRSNAGEIPDAVAI